MQNLKTVGAGILALMMMPVTATPMESQSRTTSSVVIAVPDSYPAFWTAADRPDPRAKELKALIIRRSPTGGDQSVILLNPAYLSPATLNDALTALSACGNAATGAALPNLIAIRADRSARPMDPAKAPELQARVTELQRQPVSHLAELGSWGRSVTVTNLPVCRGPESRGGSGN